MAKYISLGEYNKLYKYIWMYLAIKFVSLFIFDYNLVFDQFHNEPMKIPISPFISLSFDYLTFIIISVIIMRIEKYYKGKEPSQNIIKNQQLIFNEKNIINEYGIEKGDYFLYINLGLVVVTDLFWEIFNKIQLSLLDYWTFELFFFEIFNSKILKTKIYKHHIFSLIFILFFCSLIQIIIIIINFKNNTDQAEIFNNNKWLIPIESYLLYYHKFLMLSLYVMKNII